MTKLLDAALRRARSLPDKEQDELASFMMDFIESRTSDFELADEQVAEVKLSMQDAREGKFAIDEEVAALWKTFGL